MKDLIIVKQLPIIEENLKKLSEEIDSKVKNVKALVCNTETVKEVKKLRAELNNEFKELESQRKFVKNEIEKPYKEFEEVYKSYISSKFKEADNELANKVNEVESELKHNKEVEIKEYFEELKLSSGIDFINFGDSNITVNLSTSMKSLKTQVKDFVEKIEDELKTIKTQSYADEILVEYMKSLDLNFAIQEVTNRHFVLEQVKKKEEQVAIKEQDEQKIVEKVEEVLQAPEQIDNSEFEEKNDDEIIQIEFRVIETRERARKLIQFMKDGGYKYESITD